MQGTLPTGGQFRSSALRGKVVVFNVWGSWCPPFRAEAPILQQVWTETRPKDVQFMGINLRDNAPAARAFERRYGITYPSLFDPGGATLLAFGRSLPPTAIPATIVLDRDGHVASRIIGATTYAKLRGLVQDALTEP